MKVSLGAVLWYSWPAAPSGLTDSRLLPRPPTFSAPTVPSGNLLPHLLLFTTTTPWEVNTPAANYCGFTQPDVNHLHRDRQRPLDCLWNLTHSSRAVEYWSQKFDNRLYVFKTGYRFETGLPVYRLTSLCCTLLAMLRIANTRYRTSLDKKWENLVHSSYNQIKSAIR